MNILAILGSPHGMRGNTGRLLTAALRSAEEAGADVMTLSLADREVRPCCGCDTCHRTGRCPVKDDFARFRDAMLEADGIILASPNYIFSVSAQMKALMDRCCGPIHCVALEGKYSAAVVTSGGGGEEEVSDYMLRFLRSMGCWTVGSAGAKAWQLANPDAGRAAIQAASALGKDVVAAIAEKKTYPDQVQEKQAFAERMKQLVTMQKEAWPFEHEYWKSRGRL